MWYLLTWLIPAVACISVPKDLKLTGSSFSEGFQIGVSQNCGTHLTLTNRSDEKLSEEFNKQYEVFEKANPRPSYSDREKYEAWKAKYNKLEQKYKAKNKPVYISIRGGKLCAKQGQNCTPKLDLKEGAKHYGFIQVQGNDAFIFSTDEFGKKDIKKPYLKISKAGKASAKIEAWQNGKQIGALQTDGGTCSRGFGSASAKGAMDLAGNEYKPDGSAGCKGGFKQKKFKSAPKSELIFDGNNMGGN